MPSSTLKDMGLRVTKKPMSDNSVANGASCLTPQPVRRGDRRG